MHSPAVFFVYALVSLAAGAVAWRRIDRDGTDKLVSRRAALFLYGAVVLGFVPLMAMAIFARIPSIPARFMPLSIWPLLEREYWLPCAVLFFAAASHLVTSRNRRAMQALTVMLVVFAVGVTSWRLIPNRMHEFGRTMAEGVCLQSSDYTCGAASLVTLLDCMDIEATEGEMAMLSGTIPGRGVSDFQAARGLQLKLDELRRPESVEVRSIDDDELGSLPTPFLAGLKFSFWFDHMACVLECDGHSIVIGDPLVGRRTMTEEAFLREWRGIAIVVHE